MKYGTTHTKKKNYECGHLKINVRVGLNSEDIEVTVEDNKADDENYFDISTYSEKNNVKVNSRRNRRKTGRYCKGVK